jgi:hypothetical protein
LHVYAPRVRTRLRGVMPKVADELTDEDVLAMQMVGWRCEIRFDGGMSRLIHGVEGGTVVWV